MQISFPFTYLTNCRCRKIAFSGGFLYANKYIYNNTVFYLLNRFFVVRFRFFSNPFRFCYWVILIFFNRNPTQIICMVIGSVAVDMVDTWLFSGFGMKAAATNL